MRVFCHLSDGALGTCDPLGHFKPNVKRGSFSRHPNLSIPPGRWVKDGGFLHDLSEQISAVLGLAASHLTRWQTSSPISFPTLVPLSPAQVSRQKRPAGAWRRNEWSHQKTWEMWRQLEITARQNTTGTHPGLRRHMLNLQCWKQRGVWG